MLIFKKLSFSFNFCVISDTNVQYFPTKVQKYMHSESALNSCYVYDEIETSKEVLAGLKMMLIFLPRATSSPGFTFFG